MQPDPEYLRRHYSTLSDEALLEIDRDDLVEVARSILDSEVARRGLTLDDAHEFTDETSEPNALDSAEELPEDQDGAPPDWLDEASEVFATVLRPGASDADQIDTARAVLHAGSIPCYLDVEEDQGVHRCRLLVPGKLNQHAASLLDKEIFNIEFEAEWKAHLESMTDEEVTEMNPREAFCGLFDRVERVSRVYNQELARRASGRQ